MALDDNDEDDGRAPLTNRAIREQVLKKSSSELEDLDQELMYIKNLLPLDPDEVYNEESFEDGYTLSRAIDLLHAARFGQARFIMSAHIRYGSLPDGLRQRVRSTSSRQRPLA